jgi:putative molybdopterin biosynthesis protein
VRPTNAGDEAALGRRIAERRRRLGMSQDALAARLGVSRQFIGALEAGRSLPSIRVAIRLARVLGTTVEALFDDDHPAVRWGDPDSPPRPGVRVRWASVDGDVVVFPLRDRRAGTLADGVVGPSGEPEPVQASRMAWAEKTVAIAGCDPALALLRDWLADSGAPVRVVELPWGSGAAVRALADGRVHVAGVHGRHFAALAQVRGEVEASGAASDSQASCDPLVRVHFARWEVGVAVQPGNPKGIRGLQDLARPDVRWVRRPAETAVAALYDAALSRDAGPVRWTPVAALDHIQAAEMIALGVADAGLTTSFAAHLYGLPFEAVEEHRFEWVLPLRRLSEPAMSALLDTLRTGAFRSQMETLWGYDVTRLGDVMEAEGGSL